MPMIIPVNIGEESTTLYYLAVAGGGGGGSRLGGGGGAGEILVGTLPIIALTLAIGVAQVGVGGAARSDQNAGNDGTATIVNGVISLNGGGGGGGDNQKNGRDGGSGGGNVLSSTAGSSVCAELGMAVSCGVVAVARTAVLAPGGGRNGGSVLETVMSHGGTGGAYGNASAGGAGSGSTVIWVTAGNGGSGGDARGMMAVRWREHWWKRSWIDARSYRWLCPRAH
jgi:hypothetical protein